MNVSNTKVIVFERDERMTDYAITKGEKEKQAKEFVYVDSKVMRDGKKMKQKILLVEMKAN